MRILKFEPRYKGRGSGSRRTSRMISESANSGINYVEVVAKAAVSCPTITAVNLIDGKLEELFETGATVSGVLSVQISDMSDVVSVSQDGVLSPNPISFASGRYNWDFSGASPLLVTTTLVTNSCGTVEQVHEIAADGTVTLV